jgi:dTDP-4-dehydrorhamnose reductase
MNRLFISGGAGLLGSNWAIIKSHVSEVIVNLHRRQFDFPNLHSSNVNLMNIDDIKSFFIKNRPNQVVNTVALTSIEVCEEDPDLAYRTNVVVAKNLAIVCDLLKIKFIHISTDNLYSDGVPWSDEAKKMSPCNKYGYTKMLSEFEVMNCCPDAIVVRTNFYGKGANDKKSFSDLIIESVRSQKKIQLFNDVFYTPITMNSLIELVDALIQVNFTGVINVAGRERLSKYDFGVRLSAFLGLDERFIESVSISQRSDLVARPREMSLSTDLLQGTIGRKPPSINEDFQIMSAYCQGRKL